MTKLTIQAVEFEAPSPYQEGDTITEGEAEALNRLLRSHARKHFADEILRNPITNPEAHAEIETRLLEFIMSYSFDVHRAAQPQLSPLETAMRKIARKRLANILEENNRKLKDLGPSEINDAVAQIIQVQHKEIEDLARTELEKQQTLGKISLVELGLA